MSPALPALLAAGSFVLGVLGFVFVRDRGLAWRFEEELTGIPEARRRGPAERLLDKLGARTGPAMLRMLGAERRETIRHRIDAAGRPRGMTIDRYAGWKGALVTVFGLVAVFALLNGIWYSAIAFGVVDWIGVDVWLSGVARRRQARIDKDLPDFLDVLAVCVSAGIAFRPALARVAEATGGPLGEEITTSLRQMSLGATRREAFEALRRRNDSDFIAAFSSALLQAEELGVPLADALVGLARDMRRAAFQRARRRAQRAAPRVSLIVTTLIMPGAMLLIIAGMLLGSDIDFGNILGG